MPGDVPGGVERDSPLPTGRGSTFLVQEMPPAVVPLLFAVITGAIAQTHSLLIPCSEGIPARPDSLFVACSEAMAETLARFRFP